MIAYHTALVQCHFWFEDLTVEKDVLEEALETSCRPFSFNLVHVCWGRSHLPGVL